MNRFLSPLVKQISILSRPSLITSSSRRWLSTKKGDSDEVDQIKTIEKNEENYFENVKKSFDGLQKSRQSETMEEKRSRLLYQSRKRGTLENGLLLSHFSSKYLPTMDEKMLTEYDQVINSLINEWDLYYWLTGAVAIPAELQSNQVLKLMKTYSANENKQSRIVQPDL